MKTFFPLVLCVVVFANSALAQEKIGHGIELYRLGDYQSAANELSSLASMEGDGRRASQYLGASYVQLHKDTEARTIFVNLSKTEKQTGKVKLDPFEMDKSLKIDKKPVPNFDNIIKKYDTGELFLAVEFKSDGTIGFVFPVSTTVVEMTPLCVAAAKKIKFKPGMLKGNPVTVIRLVEYAFQPG